jgi:hypothetical protein
MEIKPKPPDMQPTATTWVAKNLNGDWERVKVADMSDQHLWRWIRFFRRQWREKRNFQGDDAALDGMIQLAIITAPAIYAEAQKRGITMAALALEPVAPTLIPATAKSTVVSKETTALHMMALAKAATTKKKKLKVWHAADWDAATPKKPAPVEPGPPGVRRINLDEDE